MHSTHARAATLLAVAAGPDVHDAACVFEVDDTASMQKLAADVGTAADPVALWAENGFIDTADAGDLIDICANNGIDDVDGSDRPVLDDAAFAAALADNVVRQQTKLNELFAGLGTRALDVDGVSGPRTGQRLCAARLHLGLDTTIEDMLPGSDEQVALFAATELTTPDSWPTDAERWILIDRTCQMLFVGAAGVTAFAFPTSTGSEGFETRDQDRSPAFRFNPAIENGGWHDSSEFPVEVDNPLNGNLYKPLYFDQGQAIHGANTVPTTPESKGCARLRVSDHDTLVAWLGLDGVTTQLWREREMNVVVTVQGEFTPRSSD